MPKVSIIIPSYNHAPFLERRLASIVAQTFQDFELLLLDDASTDGSAEICARFAHARKCRFISNAPNSGSAFKQWNKGILLAAGQYVWIAESDDYAEPQLLETLVHRLDEHRNCGLAYCLSLRVDPQDRIIGPALPTLPDVDLDRWRRDFIADGRAECATYLVRENTIPNASAVVFRRALYDRVNGVDETLRLSADWKFWAALLQCSDLAFVAAPLNYFRTHPQSVRATTRSWLQLCEALEIMRFIAGSVELPPEARHKLHTRVATLFLYALLAQRPRRADLKHAVALARQLGIRHPSLRTFRDLAHLAGQKLGRRFHGGCSQ